MAERLIATLYTIDKKANNWPYPFRGMPSALYHPVISRYNKATDRYGMAAVYGTMVSVF